LVVLRFELRDLHWLGRHSPTRAPSPLALGFFEEEGVVCFFFLWWTWPTSSYLWFPVYLGLQIPATTVSLLVEIDSYQPFTWADLEPRSS
jgi:hypothetical protein